MAERIEDRFAKDLRRATGMRWVREYRPCPSRRWAVDLAVPKIKLAVEIEGRAHGRAAQHKRDCEKFNWMTGAGWRVLRYPASSILTKSRQPHIIEQIYQVVCGIRDTQHDVLTGKLR